MIVYLPKSLRILEFGFNYNQSVDIPDNIKTLMFGKNFNYPVQLPLNVENIKFGDEYNQSLEKLPEKLKTIEFGEKFEQRIANFIKEKQLKIIVRKNYPFMKELLKIAGINIIVR
jgi:phage-related protein